MRKEFSIGGGGDFIIKTKRPYSAIELYELLEANINEKFLPIEIKKELIFGEIIVARGVGGYTNRIWFFNKFGKTQIQIYQDGKFFHSIGSFIAHLTNIAPIIDFRGLCGNQALIKELSTEIEKLINSD